MNNTVKYEYFRSNHYSFLPYSVSSRDLCITISTELAENDFGDLIVFWSYTFKRPSDSFDKKMARQILESATYHSFKIKPGYCRSEILTRIFAEMYCIKDQFKPHYRDFVQFLLAHYSNEY
jgi:hypothetical protein